MRISDWSSDVCSSDRVTHMRDEADGVIKSIEETLKIGRDTGSAVVISHHKCTVPENFGRSPETLARIDRGASEQTVDFDVYPYAASSTARSEEHTSELQPLMRISYAVFCLKKKTP